MELNQATRERNDLSNQLTVMGRKRDASNEELVRCKQKLEQVNETNARINRNLEELVKECEDKQVSQQTISCSTDTYINFSVLLIQWIKTFNGSKRLWPPFVQRKKRWKQFCLTLKQTWKLPKRRKFIWKRKCKIF